MSDSKHGGLITFKPTSFLNKDGFSHFKLNNTPYPPFIQRETLLSLQQSWSTDEHDIFICTHQKVGTHLTKKFVSEILRHGIEYPDFNPISSGDIGHHTIPWPEVMASQYGVQALHDFIDRTKGLPRVWYLHCPIEEMPFAHIHPKSKIIHVFRDPKGAAVSQYFFYKSHPLLQVSDDLTMDQFIDYFLAGNLYFGDYHEHTLNWTQGNFNRFNKDQLLVLRYEDLVESKIDAAQTLTQFLIDKPLDLSTLESIVQRTEFNAMKQSIIDNPGSFHFDPKKFFRSGTTYDWQEKLSSEQIHRIDEKSKQKWGNVNSPDLSKVNTLVSTSHANTL